MEKLTSILLVAEDTESGTRIHEKTALLARHFGARVEWLRTAAPLNEVILSRVFETSPDLVVKAPVGNRADQLLAAACPVPLLLMREYAWRSPLRIAAAVDVSNDDNTLARTIVHTAGFFSLRYEGELDVIYSEREKTDEVLRMERVVKLGRLVRQFHVDAEHVRHMDGPPEVTLAKATASGDYDILILGAVTHQTGFAALLASFDRDIVLVKQPEHSLVQQFRHQPEQFIGIDGLAGDTQVHVAL
jgi:hypothetical protein